jgi:hypothetical protein
MFALAVYVESLGSLHILAILGNVFSVGGSRKGILCFKTPNFGTMCLFLN